MYLYINVAIKYTQFPIYNDEFQRSVLGPFSIEKNFNFVPFKDFLNTSSLYNIILAVPFGFLMPFLTKTNFPRILLMGIGFSSILEGIQALVGNGSKNFFKRLLIMKYDPPVISAAFGIPVQ